jgi:hypothetical protein
MKNYIADLVKVKINDTVIEPMKVSSFSYEDMNCMRPPDGWWCSRIPGHKGPCAAHPYAPIDYGPIDPFLDVSFNPYVPSELQLTQADLTLWPQGAVEGLRDELARYFMHTPATIGSLDTIRTVINRWIKGLTSSGALVWNSLECRYKPPETRTVDDSQARETD